MFVCSHNPNHTYDDMTVDGFCPLCPKVGFLVEVDESMVGGNAHAAPVGTAIDNESLRQIGVAQISIDLSGSTLEVHSPASPATRADFFISAATTGIFSLEQISNPADQYISLNVFSDTNEQLFLLSLKDIFSRYSGPEALAAELHEKVAQHGGMTNIGAALAAGRGMYDALMRGDLTEYGGPADVRAMTQTVLGMDGTPVQIPNFRALLLTDGEDTISGSFVNPFTDVHNVLIGAFAGHGEEAGAAELRKQVGWCPKHGARSFFLIRNPQQFHVLSRLFHMASGASGFCPMCAAESQSA